MAKIDWKKELKHLWTSSAKEVTLVDVPEMNYLMVDGQGDPNTSQEFQDATEVLYTASYTLKFMVKKSLSSDYVVMPLEGLWWADDMIEFIEGNKDQWKWTLMIMQPEQVTNDLVREAFEQVKKKKNPVALSKTRFDSYHEGLSAQIMHIGPYSTERSTIEKLHEFIKENGYELRGSHHEIYLSNPRRVAPEKMKTILRQPIEREK